MIDQSTGYVQVKNMIFSVYGSSLIYIFGTGVPVYVKLRLWHLINQLIGIVSLNGDLQSLVAYRMMVGGGCVVF